MATASEVVDTMGDEELSGKLAEAMGFERWGNGFRPLGTRHGEKPMPCAPPPYCTDLNATALLEAEIKRRGLGEEYVIELMMRLDGNNGSIQSYWRMITAPARTRALAALKVLEAHV